MTERFRHVRPDTVVLMAPHKTCNHPILLWRARRDQLMLRPEALTVAGYVWLVKIGGGTMALASDRALGNPEDYLEEIKLLMGGRRVEKE